MLVCVSACFLVGDHHSELLQVLVKRVNPDLAAEGDGIVVDAILSIDTTRPSLKPLYRSALQVLCSNRTKLAELMRAANSDLLLSGKDLVEADQVERTHLAVAAAIGCVEASLSMWTNYCNSPVA